MFTGLIQRTGVLTKIETSAESGALTLQTGPWSPPLEKGESIAVNGVCLTVVSASINTVCFDVLMETFHRTSFRTKKIGDPLNLERALRMGDAMGGHYVTGHVDGTGTVRSVSRAGRDWVLEVDCSPELLGGMVPKGSIALDGISLTIADLRNESFTVHIIPHTWENTSLAHAAVGCLVNLETDILGKYVARSLQSTSTSTVSMDLLNKAGFA